MVKFSRNAINPVYPTKIKEGFQMPEVAVSAAIAVPVSMSGFLVSYPYMDYASPASNTYAGMDHLIPNDLPNAMNSLIRDEIMYNRMLEKRIRMAQDGYYQNLSGAINQSPVLSKMNIDVPAPYVPSSPSFPGSMEGSSVESFMFRSSDQKSKNMVFIALALVILGAFAYFAYKK